MSATATRTVPVERGSRDGSRPPAGPARPGAPEAALALQRRLVARLVG
ncbi:hypothetical protein ACFQH9_17495 [Pseudonocardia lutea]|jgi:hypothetical protein|uniref:Uncharacterized protein n=1 Tax=Pseudonocardia lutea TaxID=2172015 RepID=A0ABW1ICI1_9PSEU